MAQKGLVALETCDGRSRADAHGALGGLPGKEEVISFPSHRESGHSGGGSQSTHGPRPCRSPGSSSLLLSNSVQGPMRKPQNAELQEAAGEVKGLGAAGHCPPCLMQSLTQAQDPSSLSKARFQIPQLSHTPRSPLHLILGDCGSLLQAVGSMKKGCWRSSISLSSFLMQACNAIHFPLNIALAASHKFCMSYFHYWSVQNILL